MSRLMSIPRSVKPAATGFVTLTALAVAATLAHRAGMLDENQSRRAVGILVGLMAVVTGNFLPKMRPLDGTGRDHEIVATAESTAGWILILLGATFATLFALAPFPIARAVAPLAALIGFILIAGNWVWVFLVPRSPSAADAVAGSRAAIERRTVASKLLLALGYVLLMACVMLLADGARWGRSLASWSVIAYAGLQALVTILFSRRRTS